MEPQESKPEPSDLERVINSIQSELFDESVAKNRTMNDQISYLEGLRQGSEYIGHSEFNNGSFVEKNYFFYMPEKQSGITIIKRNEGITTCSESGLSREKFIAKHSQYAKEQKIATIKKKAGDASKIAAYTGIPYLLYAAYKGIRSLVSKHKQKAD
jgi:hypothetical protein